MTASGVHRRRNGRHAVDAKRPSPIRCARRFIVCVLPITSSISEETHLAGDPANVDLISMSTIAAVRESAKASGYGPAGIAARRGALNHLDACIGTGEQLAD